MWRAVAALSNWQLSQAEPPLPPVDVGRLVIRQDGRRRQVESPTADTSIVTGAAQRRAPSVFAFSREELLSALSTPDVSTAMLASAPTVAYLHSYLSEVARTIVVERGYVDESLLRDYARISATPVTPFASVGSRLHFFSSALDRSTVLEAILRTEKHRELADSYLGFATSTPLTSPGLNRILLVPSESPRTFICTRKIAVDFWGVPLNLRSVAFQHDVLVGDAVTSLTWALLEYYEHSELQHPSIYDVLQAARGSVSASRVSTGLTLEQMGRAFGTYGLTPQVFRSQGEASTLDLAFCYLRGGWPFLLALEGEEGTRAIGVVGYRLSDEPNYSAEFISPEGRLECLYAHDADLGPFVSFRIRANRDSKGFTLESERGQETPVAMLVPQVAEIQLSLIDVIRWLYPIKPIFRSILSGAVALEWDIRLERRADYLGRVRARTHLSTRALETLIFMAHPKYIWSAEMLVSGTPTVEVLLDATVLSGVMPVYHVVLHRRDFAPALDKLPEISSGLLDAFPSRYFEVFVNAARSLA